MLNCERALMESRTWQFLLVSVDLCLYLQLYLIVAHLLSRLPVLSRLTGQTFVSLNTGNNCISLMQMCAIGFLGKGGQNILFSV